MGQVFNQFRRIWADHGDDVSRQYAGTGALKSGFTRTGALKPYSPAAAMLFRAERQVQSAQHQTDLPRDEFRGLDPPLSSADIESTVKAVFCCRPGPCSGRRRCHGPVGAGKRTKAGLIDDGVKSITRYYLNNFQDGAKQDAMDYATGNYKVPKGAFVAR